MQKILRNESTAHTQKVWQAVDKAAERAPLKIIQKLNDSEKAKPSRSSAK